MNLPNQITSPTINALYEDDDLLVLNKPHSIHSARHPRSTALSIADLLAERSPLFHRASRSESDMGLVNRLDFETSGVLIAAKSREVWEELHVAFTDHTVLKYYLALMDGPVKSAIDGTAFIGTESRNAKRVRLSPWIKPRFQEALTNFEPLRPLAEATLVRAFTITGRRHQVRAHAAWVKHPLCGDSLYGSPSNLRSVLELGDSSIELPQFFLHAEEVTIPDPRSDTQRVFRAPLPDYAAALVSSLSCTAQ